MSFNFKLKKILVRFSWYIFIKIHPISLRFLEKKSFFKTKRAVFTLCIEIHFFQSTMIFFNFHMLLIAVFHFGSRFENTLFRALAKVIILNAF